ncbi:MAG: ParB/RepB/Spo0J family partition protein [Eubacteriales bacterium]|nr:ParB/RepB/Spo0J family partition protein [Clostridiales bacterium]MDD7301723.1 ParB/RepB/Spo0J family partition protein [Eubacteriales bacterium]MDY4435425.1 ParB/RepB/Spo0J family partition protein [Candidatus Flemingibacterium sp.]
MPKKQALGRGMDAIFIDNTPDSPERTDKLAVSDIEPRRDQPRKTFDPESLSSLADSIAANGLIQPIIVRPSESSALYSIVAGERRWRAARMAGLSEVPVVIIDADDRKAAEYALVENIQREDLNPIEEAEGLKSLIEDYNLTQEQAAKRVGKSRAAIANALRLLELPDEVISLVGHKSLSAGHARALLGLNDKTLIPDAAKTIVDHELSVRAAEELIKKLNSKPEPKKNDPVADSYYSSLEQKLTESLGHKVRISRSKRRRSISISYKNSDELEELIRLLGCSEALEDK